jgi:hypothetical protein
LFTASENTATVPLEICPISFPFLYSSLSLCHTQPLHGHRTWYCMHAVSHLYSPHTYPVTHGLPYSTTSRVSTACTGLEPQICYLNNIGFPCLYRTVHFDTLTPLSRTIPVLTRSWSHQHNTTLHHQNKTALCCRSSCSHKNAEHTTFEKELAPAPTVVTRRYEQLCACVTVQLWHHHKQAMQDAGRGSCSSWILWQYIW